MVVRRLDLTARKKHGKSYQEGTIVEAGTIINNTNQQQIKRDTT